MTKNVEKAMWLLRAAADLMEEEKGILTFPGLDAETNYTREADIITAARAVTGSDLEEGDEATDVKIQQVGCLVHYLADLFEE